MVFRSNSAHFAYICSSAIGFRFFHDRKQNVVGTEIRSAFRAFSIQMLAISSERATDFPWPFISNNFYKKTWRFLLRTILIVIVCCENGRRRSTCVCVTHEQLDRHKIFVEIEREGKKAADYIRSHLASVTASTHGKDFFDRHLFFSSKFHSFFPRSKYYTQPTSLYAIFSIQTVMIILATITITKIINRLAKNVDSADFIVAAR